MGKTDDTDNSASSKAENVFLNSPDTGAFRQGLGGRVFGVRFGLLDGVIGLFINPLLAFNSPNSGAN